MNLTERWVRRWNPSTVIWTIGPPAASAQIPVGAATKDVNALTVFVVNDGPGLVELDGTAACRINLVAGEYS